MRTGKAYRLLSEAEWEYVARAGTRTPFSFGRTITPDQANYNGTYSYDGGAKGRYLGKTAPAGSYPANAFGVHDMHGNVGDWVEDLLERKLCGCSRERHVVDNWQLQPPCSARRVLGQRAGGLALGLPLHAQDRRTGTPASGSGLPERLPL